MIGAGNTQAEGYKKELEETAGESWNSNVDTYDRDYPVMKDAIIKSINLATNNFNFRRKSSTWFLDLPESIILMELQKSQWGRQYYINLAVWAKELGEPIAIPPKERICHLRTRLSQIASSRIGVALDFADATLDEQDRAEIIRDEVSIYAIPFLLQCGTMSGIADAYKQGKLNRAMIAKQLKDLIYIRASK